MEIVTLLAGKSSSYIKNSAHFVEKISYVPIYLFQPDDESRYRKSIHDETQWKNALVSL